MTYLFDYDYGTNAWHLAHHPHSVGGLDQPEYDIPGITPPGHGNQDWSLYGEMYGVSDGAAMGLVVQCLAGTLRDRPDNKPPKPPGGGVGPPPGGGGGGGRVVRNIALLGTWNMDVTVPVEDDDLAYVVQGQGTIYLRIDYHSDTQELHLRSASTPGVWQDLAVVPVASPVDTGIYMWYTDPDTKADGYITNISLVPTIEDLQDTTDFTVSFADFGPVMTPFPTLAYPGITASVEPTVYALIGAPFGDQEFDIGKSARWLEYFSDKLFALDVNLGDPRYWIINWTLTFPEAEHAVTSINFFERPVDFRKEQYRLAHKQYNLLDDDWVVWVDGSEGLSFDNASLPDDYDFESFMAFIYREIARAEAANQTSVVLPLFIFLRSGEIQNVTYDHLSNGDGSTPPVLQPISVPYYLPYQGLRRLTKVSALRDPAFDWTSLDQPATPTSGVKAQIVSYAYAHWQYLDIPPGATEVPPLSEANDEGFKMRRRISKVRPVASLPSEAWDPAADPAGVPGPWAGHILTNTNPDFVPITDNPITPPAAAAAGVNTPLYDTVLRLNLRDGVWYEGANTVDGSVVSGNTPLTWDPVTEKWQTPYNPDVWPSTGTYGGVNAPPNPDYVDPPTPVP